MINRSIYLANIFIQRMNFLFRTIQWQEHIHSRDDFVDFLLSTNINEMNKYIWSHFVRTIGSCHSLNSVDQDCLYVVFFEGKTDYLLGNEFVSPLLGIPTFHQLHAEYKWFKGLQRKPPIPYVYDSLDALVRARIDYALDWVAYLQNVLQQGITPWEYVFRSNEGPEIQENLLQDAKCKLSKVRKDIRELKDTGAPVFMQEEYRVDMEKTRTIVRCLSKVTHT